MWRFFINFIIFSWGSLFYDFTCSWSWIWWSCWASVLSGNHFCFLNVHPWCYRNTSGKLLDTVNIVSKYPTWQNCQNIFTAKNLTLFGFMYTNTDLLRALQNRVLYLVELNRPWRFSWKDRPDELKRSLLNFFLFLQFVSVINKDLSFLVVR